MLQRSAVVVRSLKRYWLNFGDEGGSGVAHREKKVKLRVFLEVGVGVKGFWGADCLWGSGGGRRYGKAGTNCLITHF